MVQTVLVMKAEQSMKEAEMEEEKEVVMMEERTSQPASRAIHSIPIGTQKVSAAESVVD